MAEVLHLFRIVARKASGWGLKNLLPSCYWLFEDTLARQEVYSFMRLAVLGYSCTT